MFLESWMILFSLRRDFSLWILLSAVLASTSLLELVLVRNLATLARWAKWSASLIECTLMQGVWSASASVFGSSRPVSSACLLEIEEASLLLLGVTLLEDMHNSESMLAATPLAGVTRCSCRDVRMVLTL